MVKTTLKVKAGNHSRNYCPVSVLFPLAEIGDAERIGLALAGVDTPCQTEVLGDQVRVTWVVRKLGATKVKGYDVKSRRSVSCGCSGVELVDHPGDHVAVFLGGKPFTNYYYGAAYPRPFLHPLTGPFRKTVTRDFPMPGGPEAEKRDHKHHRSVWTAWGQICGVDNWSEETGHGRVIHTGFDELRQGPVYGRIVARNNWVSNEGKKVCEEVREITFYSLPAAVRLLDYNVTFVGSEGPMRFGDTKEGGILSIRVATSMDVPLGGRITNSFGGIDEGETWGKRAHWCDYTGPVDGKVVGITVFDHPTNFRHPTYWHVRNYGLMTANPFGVSYFTNNKANDGSHEVPANERFTFRYRLLVHKGTAEEASVAEHYHDYVNPPVIDK